MSRVPADPDEPGLRRSLLRWETGGSLLFLLLVLAFPLYRAVEGIRRAEALAEREAALIASGRQLWAANCATCHGPTGEGLPGIPALRSREFLREATDAQIHHIVAAGIPGTAMSPWWNEVGGPLTDEQIRALVAHIRSWEGAAPSRPDWRSPTPAPSPSPSPTAEQPRDLRSVTVTERGCEPLELDVDAGKPFTLLYVNRSGHGSSLDIESLGQHIHAPPGETATVRLTLVQEGDYQFECLGEEHGDLLGAGVIHAR